MPVGLQIVGQISQNVGPFESVAYGQVTVIAGDAADYLHAVRSDIVVHVGFQVRPERLAAARTYAALPQKTLVIFFL
jgi:hypothetical protein